LFDKATGKLSFKKLKINDNEDIQLQFYNKLPSVDITAVLQFVNEQCQFLKVFKPLKQPNSKKLPREGELFAIIMAEAMNHAFPVALSATSRGALSWRTRISVRYLSMRVCISNG
jgi:hypothetical protein